MMYFAPPLTPSWSPQRRPQLWHCSNELQKSVASPLPSLPKTTVPALTCSSWSLQVLSISKVSAEVHAEKGRFQKGYPQTLPLLPIACSCLPLHSTALPFLPTVLQMVRWAHLDTASPWDSTGGAQWCWWSTVLQSHCPSSLQEQGKFFTSGEREKNQSQFQRGEEGGLDS